MTLFEALTKPVLCLALALLVFIAAGCKGETLVTAPPVEAASPAAVPTAPPPAAPAPIAVQIDVLFVGNSYTYYNDMPTMVEQLAVANGANISADMLAPGGYFLSDHVRDGDVLNALASGKYEIMVLQEQSVAPSLANELTQRTIPAAEVLDTAADRAGVRVILYQTWGRESGLSDVGFSNYDQMQASLVQGYRQIAESTGAETAPVGASWQQMRRSGVPISLYDPDGSHPSAAGSYLAAVQITETILRVPLSTAPAVPGVNEDVAEAILAFG